MGERQTHISSKFVGCISLSLQCHLRFANTAYSVTRFPSPKHPRYVDILTTNTTRVLESCSIDTVKMLARSSRRFFILSLTAFASVLVVLQYSSWGHDKVFEVSSLFESMSTPTPKALIHWGDYEAVQSQHAKIWQYEAKYSVSNANMFAHKTAATGQVSTLYSSSVESSTPTATSPSKTLISSPATPRSSNVKDYVKQMLNWNRPTWEGHWPPYNDYVHKGYDPNRWEQFPM